LIYICIELINISVFSLLLVGELRVVPVHPLWD